MFHVEQITLLSNALELVVPGLDEPVLQQFVEYRALLLEWNRRINLISRRDESRIVQRHFLDSVGLLTAASFPSGSKVLDIGTGAGFPGVPMKIVRPDLSMTLIDSKRRKGLFLRHVCDTLKLSDVEVVVGRVEEVGRLKGPFDILVSRSVTDLTTLVRWSHGCWKRGARLIVIKGESVFQEVEHLQNVFQDETVVSARVTGFNPFPDRAPRVRSFVVIVELGAAGEHTVE